MPLAAEGHIFGGCEFIRYDDRPRAKKSSIVCKHLRRSFLSSPNKSRAASLTMSTMSCYAGSAITSASSVAITNAVLSRPDMDELVSEVAKEIHYYFDIDDISIVLRSHRKNKLNIYSTHYLDKQHPAHEQSEVDEAGTLTERVFKSKEMLLINLHERDDLAPYERMLFDTGQPDSNLVPVTADVWRHHAGRAETGAMRRESVYHYQSEFTAPDCRTCGNRCR